MVRLCIFFIIRKISTILSCSGIKQWIWYYKEYLHKIHIHGYFQEGLVTCMIWRMAKYQKRIGDNICYNTMMVVFLKTLCLDYFCSTQYRDSPVIGKVTSSLPQTDSLEENHQQFKNYNGNFNWKMLATLLCWDILLELSKEAITTGVPILTT